MMQVNNLEKFLAWVKSSPCQFTVSSMSGGFVHVKFLVPCDKEIAQMVELEDRDALIDKCYEDGFNDGRKGVDTVIDMMCDNDLGDDPKYRKGHADGVQEAIHHANRFGE